MKTMDKAGGLNISYKVETKDIPKLPAEKSLRGKIFDDWHTSFYTKMCQANINDIMQKDYKVPNEKDMECQHYKTKAAYLKNHLLSATIGSHAISFIDARCINGLEMYKKLLEIY